MEEKNNIVSKILLWIMLIFIPPVGIIYLWVNKNFDYSKKKMKTLSWIFGIYSFIFLSGVMSNLGLLENTETANVTTSETTTQANISTEETTHRGEIYGISDKDISEISKKNTFSINKVRNDVTGNWRISLISDTNFDAVYYAVSYYKTYFNDDKEIHAIVNFANNTTTKIQCMDNILYLTTYDYVKDEEHDANLLFSGTVLQQYMIYLDNGDIQQLS